MEEQRHKKLVSFLSKNEPVKFKRGEIIVRPGDTFPYIYYLKSGFVRVYSLAEEGKEITIYILKPLFSLSLLYAIKGEKSKYYFEALTPVEVWRIPREDTLKFFEENQDASYEVMKYVIEGFDEIFSNIENLIGGDAKRKVIYLLINLARRFGEKTDGKYIIKFGITHKLIASMTGLTRETVSIQMGKLQKKSLIHSEGRFLIINNAEELEKQATL